MTRDVEELFERASALSGDARTAFIDEACAGDSALRAELTSLLEHSAEAERLFGRLAGAVRATVPALDHATARQFATDDLSGASPLAAGALGPDPMHGRSIGRYHIRALLGRGGMGAVYRAHDERLDRDVALKFLPPHLASVPGAAGRFRVEARAAAAIVHPNVCTVHEIGETDDGSPFIAMALYEGETLKARLRRGALPPGEAVTIARELASGLRVAHAAGIVHRDVKPANVMLARDGVTRLLDFGLAKFGDTNLTPNGATPGTLAYMSPEQARGDALDHRSDLWSLGVVLHEMLAGARPFQGRDGRDVVRAILHDPPAPLPGNTPLALQHIVARLLRKAPGERYADAAAVEAELVVALSPGATVPPAPPARPVIARRWAAVAVVVIAAVSLAGLWRRDATPADGAPVARSLAVMPFVDMSGGAADPYFGDGLSEEITTALGRIEGLRVAARSSAFALRGLSLDARRIGDTLGVDAVLEGSVRRAGDRLRVSAQLADARTGLRVWADEYDRDASDVLTVQDEIARAITDALELRLPAARSAARAPRAMDLAAYDLYLRALQLRNSLSADGLQRATDLLDRAIELQPDFALAYAAKASVVLPRIYHGHIPHDRGMREVRAAIDRAFALDPDLPEAHVARGVVQLFFERDWPGAERSLRRAVALNPSDAHGWHHLGNYLRAMDRPAEAIVARLRGLALDPLNARARFALGEDYLYAGRPDEALAPLARVAQLDPLLPGLLGLGPQPPVGPGRIYMAQGRLADGVEEMLRVATLRGASLAEIDSLRTAFSAHGIQGFWRRWLVMDRDDVGSSIDPLRIASLSALGGDTAQALASLERAVSLRHPGLIFLRTEPAFDGLRALPRYRAVEQRVGFPPP